MKAQTTSGSKRIVGYSSAHTVALAIGWPESEITDLLGFAIRRRNPDGTSLWLQGALGFRGQVHTPGEPISSNESPFQKMYWADYQVREGLKYRYEVIPVVGQPNHPDVAEDQTLPLDINTESNKNRSHQVFFNRAVVAGQAYVRNFGRVDPTADSRILTWLARGLDRGILDFIDKANTDKTLRLDVAGYHMDHPRIIETIAKTGSRARVLLSWSKDADVARNRHAAKVLDDAGVNVGKRETVPNISHCKFIILKNSHNDPLAVLTGSTNFTVSGVSQQNNVCHVVNDVDLAKAYLEAFELFFADDNEQIRAFNEKGKLTMPGSEMAVIFSPHKSHKGGRRIDLDEYISLVESARSSVFFATFRATDEKLNTAMAEPTNKDVVIRGMVDNVYEGDKPGQGAGDTILYHEAFEKDPAVVPARPLNEPLTTLVAEPKRQFKMTKTLSFFTRTHGWRKCMFASSSGFTFITARDGF
jgi:hypothetical protein